MNAPFVVSRQGGEFLVNTTTANLQANPTITGLTNGGFVVAWDDWSGPFGSTNGSVKAQVYDAEGAKIGDEILVDAATVKDQEYPLITSLTNGGFVLTWKNLNNQSGNFNGVSAQIFDKDGQKIGGEFLANSDSGGTFPPFTIGGLTNGSFVVAWTDYNDRGADTSSTGIVAQIFDASGQKIGAEMLVNSITVGQQYNSSIVGLANGGFVVAWTGRENGEVGGPDTFGVKAQVFDALGRKVGGEFLVNTSATSGNEDATITGLTNGGFVIAWTDYSGQGGDADGTSIKAQVYDAAGAKVGAEFLVNTATASGQYGPTITGLTNGGFVISWTDYSGQGGDASSGGIKAQAFDPSGAKVGAEFLVNTATAGAQEGPVITGLTNGRFAVGWMDASGQGGDADSYGIKSQIFATNETPVITAPSNLVSSGGDGRITFSVPHNTALAVADDGSSLTTTLDVAHGILTLAGSAGLSVAGEGTGHLVATGTPADTSAALAGLSYQAAAGYGGADTLSVTTSDGALSETASIALSDRAALPHSYVPSGSEVLVNTATASDQVAPTIAGLSGGGFVVTWADYSGQHSGQGGDTNGPGIKAQAFDPSGAKVGAEFLVNTATASDQISPTITGLTNGGFVVAWQDSSGQGVDAANTDTNGYGIKAQIYDAVGQKVGSEFLVNTTTSLYQTQPTITGLTNGGFAVTWQDESGLFGQGADGNSDGIKGQLYDAVGQKVGSEFLVNTITTGAQQVPTIIGLANGGFAVAWQDSSGQGVDAANTDTSGYGIKAQIYDAIGAKVGSEFLVNTATANNQYAPKITGLSDGSFVVTWQDSSRQGGDADGYGIKAQVFSAAGSKIGGEFLVNTATANNQYAPTITGLSDGGFVVTWTNMNDIGGDASDGGVKAQVFSASGQRVGTEFLVNTVTESSQSHPTVTGLSGGGFAVTWQDQSGHSADADGASIKAQVYALDQIGSLTLSGLQDGHAVEGRSLSAAVIDPEGAGAGVTYTFKTGDTVLQIGAGDAYTPTHTAVGQAITVTAAYTDGAGHAATLAQVANATLDLTPPAVTGVDVPASRTYATGQALDFTVHFGEAVSVVGTPGLALTLDTGGLVSADYLSGSGTDTLTFRHVVASGEATSTGIALGSAVALNGGTIQDASSNGAVLALTGLPSTAGVRVDGIAPAVSAFVLATAGPTNATTLSERVVFSETVAGLGAAAFTLTSTGTASARIGSVTGSGSVYNVTLTDVVGNGTLRLDLTDSNGIRDTAGNALKEGALGTSVTLDHTAPSLTLALSAGNGVGINHPLLADAAPGAAPGTLVLNAAEFAQALQLGGKAGDAGGFSTDPAHPAGALISFTAADGHTVDQHAVGLSSDGAGGLAYDLRINAPGTPGGANQPLAAQLTDGTYTVQAGTQDAAGNTGTSAPTTIVIDTTADAGTPASLVVGGTTDGIINAAEAKSVGFTVAGLDADASAVVTFSDGTHTAHASMASNGAGTVDLTGFDGAVTSALAIIDVHGNTAAASGNALRADTHAPILSLSPVSGTANHAGGHLLSGGIDLADAGLTLTIRDGATILGTAASDTNGHFSFVLDTSGVGAGHAYVLTASVSDVAGNLGTSASIGYTLDFTPNQTSFGTLIHDGHSVGGEIYALYDGLLGRTADALGLEGWAALIKAGLSLHDVAAGFLASAEGQSRAGAAGNAAFVEQLYEANLHRASDPGGKAGWVHELDTGHMDRAGVSLGFVLSEEHLNNLSPTYQAGVFAPDADAANVARLYDGVLGRAPDAGGLASWTSAVADGTSLHDVASAMLATSEYRGVSTGYTDPGFVAALYQQVLGRAGDASGTSNWTDYLAHGGARGTVIDGFTSSAEFQGHYAGQSSRDYVEGLYEHILNRTGDTNGLNGWAAQIDSHAMSRAQVAQQFTGSAEFQQKYVAPSDAVFVDQIYVNALGRHADAGGLASWTDQLAHGTSRADVAVALSVSPEARAHHLADIEQGWHLA